MQRHCPFKVDDDCILVVTAGDAKIDNQKYKAFFQKEGQNVSPGEVLDRVGHGVGGVCPFAIPDDVKVYLDESMKRFPSVYPACGSSNSAIELTCGELFKYSNALAWIDVCKY